MLFVKKLAGTNGWPGDNILVYTAFPFFFFFKFNLPSSPSLFPTPLFIDFFFLLSFHISVEVGHDLRVISTPHGSS